MSRTAIVTGIPWPKNLPAVGSVVKIIALSSSAMILVQGESFTGSEYYTSQPSIVF